MKVMDAIRHVAKTKPVRAAITLSRSGPTLLIRAEPRETGLPEMTVHMVRYDPEERVEIGAGENEGRAITYTHIAHDWQVLGDWNGQAPLDMAVPIEGDDPVVVVLQEPHYGPVVAAARLR